MNIKEAKNYIKDTVQLYLKKDEFGEYRIPVVRQRPIFLLGAPGIGKTAIMEQIAQELGTCLVSYSMTHHTRQSALGLPFITRKSYDGQEVSVSEYTMSEIIASIYDTMEESGIKEGILFLDEINCVSETLAPSMLQFLQYKVFGRHSIPQGWVVVTAGNPPEYNKSVREFDVVTYDRLKVLEVEPDYGVWKEYAGDRHLHHAILSYLELKKDQFYVMEMTTKGKSYVTARGWEDLSEILYLYEEDGLHVDETLVAQYLRNEKVVKEFTAYYDLYCKYKKDYPVEDILHGKATEQMVERARQAAFDERLSLLGMLTERVQADMQETCERAAVISDLKPMLVGIGSMVEAKNAASKEVGAVSKRLELLIEGQSKGLESLRQANALSEEDRRQRKRVLRFLEEGRKELTKKQPQDGMSAYELLKSTYQDKLEELKESAHLTGGELHELFAFVENALGEGNELLILVTELTVNTHSSRFIATFGSPDYQKHSQAMMLSERSLELAKEIGELNL